MYLSERERGGRRGKSSVQTITTRKLDEKNGVKVAGGIPNASIACCSTYQLHTGQAPLGNPICLEEVTKKIEPGKRSDVPCNKTYQRSCFPQFEPFPARLCHEKPPTSKRHKESLICSVIIIHIYIYIFKNICSEKRYRPLKQ